MGIMPQVVTDNDQSYSMVIAFSLLFPSSNYTYFILSMARWEYQGQKTDLMKDSPKISDTNWTVQGIILWVLLIIQILVYPIIAAVIERWLYGTESKGRIVTRHGEKQDAHGTSTVLLRGFSKM